MLHKMQNKKQIRLAFTKKSSKPNNLQFWLDGKIQRLINIPQNSMLIEGKKSNVNLKNQWVKEIVGPIFTPTKFQLPFQKKLYFF